MPQREMKNNMQIVHLGNLTLSGTTPAASSWVDTRGWDTCTLVVVSNTVTDAGTVAGIDFEVQESNTTAAADATAVSDLELEGLENDLSILLDTQDNVVPAFIGYKGNQRYARLVGTGTTNTAADVSVLAILTMGSRVPADSGVGSAVAAT